MPSGSTHPDLLKFMNSNANADFSDMDRELCLEKGMSHYIYNRLFEKGVIKRPTLTISNLPIRYSMLFTMSVDKGASFFNSREKLLLNMIKDGHQQTNKFSLIGNTLYPLGIVFVVPNVGGGGLHDADQELASVEGVGLSSSVLTGTPIGSFCHRLYDNSYSGQYKALIEEYKKEKSLNAVDYGL